MHDPPRRIYHHAVVDGVSVARSAELAALRHPTRAPAPSSVTTMSEGKEPRTRPMGDADAIRLDELRKERQEALVAGKPLEPLVAGPEHELLARQVAADLRALVDAAGDLSELVRAWQYLAGMCGLFDELRESERPDRDWRSRIEQALAFIEEATA